MQGNVEELTLDEFSPLSDAAQESDPVHKPDNEKSKIVVKGGGWWESAEDCRPSTRHERKRRSAAYRGFRVVLANPIP